MRNYNPFSGEIEKSLAHLVSIRYLEENIPKRIRELYGIELGKMQERAKKLIENVG